MEAKGRCELIILDLVILNNEVRQTLMKKGWKNGRTFQIDVGKSFQIDVGLFEGLKIAPRGGD